MRFLGEVPCILGQLLDEEWLTFIIGVRAHMLAGHDGGQHQDCVHKRSVVELQPDDALFEAPIKLLHKVLLLPQERSSWR